MTPKSRSLLIRLDAHMYEQLARFRSTLVLDADVRVPMSQAIRLALQRGMQLPADDHRTTTEAA